MKQTSESSQPGMATMKDVDLLGLQAALCWPDGTWNRREKIPRSQTPDWPPISNRTQKGVDTSKGAGKDTRAGHQSRTPEQYTGLASEDQEKQRVTETE